MIHLIARPAALLFTALLFAAAPLSAQSTPSTPATTPTATSAPATLDDQTDSETDADSEPQFLRFVEDGPNSARLEVAEVTFTNAAGVILRLVSAVHIGETAYYQTLQDGFRQDDVVLYEMVKPRGAPAPRKGEHADHSIAQLQQTLKSKMDLAYQLDEVDYRQPNFVHADLDWENFTRLQHQRNESMATLMMRAISDSLSRGQSGGSGGDSNAQLMALIAAPDHERQMRLLLAREMQHMEAMIMGLEGPDGSVILSERNKQAIKILRQQLKLGHKRLSIFYGAAHMPDLSRRVQSLGFTQTDSRWVTAWDVSIRKNRPSLLQKWLGGGTAPATRPTTQPIAH